MTSSLRRNSSGKSWPSRAAIARAVEQGELPAADPGRDAEAAYRLAMGTMQSCLSNGRRPSKADVAHLVGFVVGGLRESG
jgi:hypothetical protein